VLPPFNGGLHCGIYDESKAIPAGTVLPPFNGGLHCGAAAGPWHGGTGRSAPAFQRRAPLRPAGHRPETLPIPACSRLSTAGSIAAVMTTASAGRIWPVLPPFNGGLHCGVSRAQRAVRVVEVLPPFNGGLHCGRGARRAMVGWRDVLPPFNGGLHCGLGPRPLADLLQHRAPAFQRRAPLRRDGCQGSRGLHGRVLPPFNGGLHCGDSQRWPALALALRCSRLSTAGSIAACGT